MTKPTRQQIRQRLRDDYKFYAKNCVKIRTKKGEIKSLSFNVAQDKLHETIEKQYAETGLVRIIILKARQQGFSTYVHGRLYFRLSQQRAKKGIVLAHSADSSRALFDMYRRTHAEMPELMRPATRYSSRKELKFSTLDSGIMVATAGGDSIARGETLSHAHLSEMAFWPPSSAADNLNGLLKCIPNEEDTEVYIESTANGMTGEFYKFWKAAEAGENGFVAFFSPWFDTPEYRIPVRPDFERTFEEEELVEKYDLDDEQLMFRRVEIAKNGRDLFMQEYPCTAEEAFLNSGRPVFNPDQINEMLANACEPLYRGAFEGTSFHKHPRGELAVYRKREAGETYYIGADVAMGLRDGDYSVAQVLDSQKRQVAVWRGHIHPDYFADTLYALGMRYNEAMIGVESNNHGLLTAVRLGRDLNYPNIYTEVTEGALEDRESIRIGFNTNARTKPLIIDRLRGSLRDNELEIYDKTTLQEMRSYIVTESGKMEAEAGCHDDCVTSLALCNHLHVGKFTPIEVTDDYYIEAV